MTTGTDLEEHCSAKYINPVIASTMSVFEMMLDCSSQRSGVHLKDDPAQSYDVNAVIGFTGTEVGAVVLGLPRKTALGVMSQMVGIEASEIDSEVLDAIGELVNMIAGGAKSTLDHLQLSIGTPTFVPSGGRDVPFPQEETPICVLFDSQIGPFGVEFAFAKQH